MSSDLQDGIRQGNTVPIEILHKEIDLVQKCISRMANNSFLIKGWWISLYAIVFAILQEKVTTPAGIMQLTVMAVLLWTLDARYLQMERKYRERYNELISERTQGSNNHLYGLDIGRFNGKALSLPYVMFSSTLWPFYCLPLIITLIIAIAF